ncbi:MAG TPA: 4Fe-4S dicluster domain-containing protein [Candidatus Desulfaltia sp.]|nr:4Fe-4S dicluster domain-containing protein [Candidatus Desulfaltia sp.]
MPRFLRNVLENLFGKPATVRYPFEKPPLPEGTRGELNFNMVRCDQCQDCERICPSAAITVHVEEKTIDWEPFKCIYCHACVRACMHKAIEAKDNVSSPGYKVSKKTFKA